MEKPTEFKHLHELLEEYASLDKVTGNHHCIVPRSLIQLAASLLRQRNALEEIVKNAYDTIHKVY